VQEDQDAGRALLRKVSRDQFGDVGTNGKMY